MTRRPWPARIVVREGLSAARTGRWTSALLITATAWAIGVAGAVDASWTSDLVRAEQRWLTDGGQISVASGWKSTNVNNPVPTVACDGLANANGVSAFAAAAGRTAHLRGSPGGAVPLYEVSPTALEFFGAAPAEGGVALVSDSLAQRLGIHGGNPIVVLPDRGIVEGSPVLTARVVHTKQLGDELDGAILLPALIGQTAETCYFHADAAHASAAVEYATSRLEWRGKPPLIRPRMQQGDYTVTFSGSFAARPLRYAWVAAASILGLLWAMAQWSRRSETAIYRTFGMRRAERMLMGLAEWSAVTGIGALWGWTLGIVGSLAAGARTQDALRLVSLNTVLTLAGAGLLAWLVGLRPAGSLLDDLKDK